MARELPFFNTAPVEQPTSTRKGHVRQGIGIELVTIVQKHPGGVLLWP